MELQSRNLSLKFCSAYFLIRFLIFHRRRISKEEFVGIISDILKLRKNVCLSRHFQNLNKASLFSTDKSTIFGTRTKKKLYLDVWLVDFFSPDSNVVSDTSSLFILQLACIVNMVPRWKKMQIRVFICARDCISGSQSSEETRETEESYKNQNKSIT